jgi:hypothetical protein
VSFGRVTAGTNWYIAVGNVRAYFLIINNIVMGFLCFHVGVVIGRVRLNLFNKTIGRYVALMRLKMLGRLRVAPFDLNM